MQPTSNFTLLVYFQNEILTGYKFYPEKIGKSKKKSRYKNTYQANIFSLVKTKTFQSHDHIQNIIIFADIGIRNLIFPV